MRTVGWASWTIPIDGTTRKFGRVTVSLSAEGDTAKLSHFGNKAMVVDGNTLGADAVHVTDSEQPTLLVKLDGLAPGPHTFIGFHHAPGGPAGSYRVSVGNQHAGSTIPSTTAAHNDDVGNSFIEFEVQPEKAVVVRITAEAGERVILSGFALDVSDPKQKALKPQPVDFERHAAANDQLLLSWTAAKSAVWHEVYVASDLNLQRAMEKVANATRDSDSFARLSVKSSIAVPIEPNNSQLHYVWRIDTIHQDGSIIPGDIWRFRIRHLAFPTAEGYGRFALGGRGGRVMHVTNLHDSGTGSLRDAVESIGPRTVVFDVSGLITLKSKLVFRSQHEFLTVAGQTAPGKGICIRNYTFGGLGGRDTILRFIRLRLGDLAGKTMDGMGLASCDHSIIDHCSISWTLDEAFSSRGAKNVTFQRNLISEALHVAGHSHYKEGSGHGYAGSIGGNVGSFHHSLLAHNAGRNWSLAGATDQVNRHAGRLDIRNMVVYNWHHRTTDGGAKEVNFVNNYYKPGPASKIQTYLNPQFENPSFGPQQYFVEGNVMVGVSDPEGPLGPFVGVAPRGTQDAPVTVPRPFFHHHVNTHSAKEAYKNVLANVGCNVPMLDEHDRRVIAETQTGTARYRGSVSGLPGIPDSQDDVGGWENYPEVYRPEYWDTDRDGMPNAWEIEKGLNPDNPADGAIDSNGDGYTNLEHYLNWLAAGNAP